jgi:WD40-like Beta Propeller Repeat
MSNSEHTRQEHSEELDPDIEIVDLEPSEPTDTLDKIKHDLSVRVAEKLPARPFLFRRGNSQLAVTAAVVLVGVIILLSASGVFSSLIARVTPSQGLSDVPPASPTLPLLEQNTMRCLLDTAWSPDNQHIAVLGYGVDCPQGTNLYMPGLVNVYDAQSAKLIAHVHPDAAILSALKKQFKQFAGKQALPPIYYRTLLWSPDEHYLALLFYAAPPLNPTAIGIDGVLLLGKDGKQHVFLRQEKPEEAHSYSYIRWDVQQGVATVVPYPAFTANSNEFIPTSAALSYHWGAGDVLIADTQTGNASPPATPLSPVGNPDGDSSFSTWQPGFVFQVTQNGNGTIHVPGAYVWQSFFPAWSPDGRSLVDGLVSGVLLEVPGQKSLSRQELKDLGVGQLPALQVHDKALVQVLQALPSQLDSNEDLSTSVSWRPDGRVLATYNAGKVTIYDCATGRKLASLVPTMPPANLNGAGGPGAVLRWSPDGTHLLLSSTNLGPMQLWGPDQLPIS